MFINELLHDYMIKDIIKSSNDNPIEIMKVFPYILILIILINYT